MSNPQRIEQPMYSGQSRNNRYDYAYRSKPMSLEIPLKFADTKSYRDLFGDPPPEDLSLTYLWQPPKSGAAWFPERYRLTPDFDLSRYTARAEVDYIRIGFTTAGHLNRARLSTRLREAIGVSVSIEPTAPGGSGHTHTARIQQPTRTLTETLIKLLGEQEGLSCTGTIEEIEISVDWYANNESDADRWLMTELLWRHLLPDADYWRDLGGFPRCCWGGSRETRHLLTIPSEDKTHDDEKQPERYGVPLGMDPLRDAALELRNYNPAKANGTIYYGARDAAAMTGGHPGVSFRIMHKVIDNQNRVTGTRTVLDEGERRARMEITLRGPALDELRVSRLDDLPAAIKKIRK
ncbi:hypothetical protein HMH01_17625, partial [Halovulum dunhuangense]